jgi:hypothetical protein
MPLWNDENPVARGWWNESILYTVFVEENPVPEVGGTMEIPVYYCVCGTMKIL